MMRKQTGDQTLDDVEPRLGAKVAFLSSPTTYRDINVVDTRETHMAWVFLAGERVYKLKKPVRYPFLDYGTLEARRHTCNEEVRLNRRLAPDVYLGVARLTVEGDGSLAINGEVRSCSTTRSCRIRCRAARSRRSPIGSRGSIARRLR
jgi:hypothetical protein